MALTNGTRLGPYEIIQPIGAGGMGQVYKARDTRLNRTVAIKVLSPEFALRSDWKQRFEREAQTIASLNHAHICTLYDVGQQDGIDYLVMEFLEGQTLAQRLERGALPLDVALKIAIEIADALDKAHRQGIVHRDLKPANVMLTKTGVKLLDFGLAKPTQSGSAAFQNSNMPTGNAAPNMTAEGTIVGTLQYMSPEQLEGIEADARTDIFAFGAVLYEMLTGRKAFAGRSQSSLIAAIMQIDPPEVSQLQPMTPPILDRIVKMCLAKDRDERWQTAHDLQSELEWIAHSSSQAGLPAPVAASRKSRERLAWALFAIAVLSAVSFAFIAARYGIRPVENHAIVFEVPTPPMGNPYQFALSPDGRKLAFVTNAGSGGDEPIFLRTMDSTTVQPLPGTQGAFQLFWSSDSRYIGFLGLQDAKLKIVESSGGPPQTLSDFTGINVTSRGSWNSDGVIIVGSGKGIYRVSASGGTPTLLTTLDQSRHETVHTWPYFLPDGQHFLYLAWSTQPEDRAIYVGSLDGKTKRLIMPAESMATFVSPGFLIFQRDGTLLAQPFDINKAALSGEPFRLAGDVAYNAATGRGAFEVSSNGILAYRSGGPGGQQRRLVWLDRSGKVAGKTLEFDGLTSFDLSPNGTRVALDRTVQGNRDVWLTDLIRGGDTRFTFNPTTDGYPIWSPDGSQIAFESNRTGKYAIYIKSSSGVGEERLLSDASNDSWPQDFSKDGKYLLYYGSEDYSSNAGDLWALPLTGDDRKPIAIATTPFAEMAGAFSPDGRWIAYQTNESGRFEVVVQPFPTPTSKWQVSTNGGIFPQWRPDGKELYFISPDNKMMVASVSASGSAFSAGIPEALFPVQIGRNGSIKQYAVSRDGRFLINQPGEGLNPAPITVVVNWTALLNKK
jgi:serine/threonine protein kinase